MRGISVAATALVICCVACGGGGNARATTRTSPSTPAAPPTWLLSGVVVDTVSRAPVQGATVEVAGFAAVTTDGGGRFEIRSTTQPVPKPAVKLSAPGYVSRDTFVSWSPRERTNVTFDIIAERAPFSLDCYRALVRNGFWHTSGQNIRTRRRATAAAATCSSATRNGFTPRLPTIGRRAASTSTRTRRPSPPRRPRARSP